MPSLPLKASGGGATMSLRVGTHGASHQWSLYEVDFSDVGPVRCYECHCGATMYDLGS